MKTVCRLAVVAAALALHAPSHAFGPEGHAAVGALADGLLADAPATQAQVRRTLDGLTLAQAAVWADCVRAVDPAQGYRYEPRADHTECRVFETPERIGRMQDFVRRNDVNCERKASQESCHKQYHYADVPQQRGRYDAGFVGARDDDIVAATTAALRKLRGQPVPPPFSFADAREALMLLAHYVGDLHQPLHVGAVYLDAQGRLVDPAPGASAEETATRGGNALALAQPRGEARNLHALWDTAPQPLDAAGAAPLHRQAEAVPESRAAVEDGPVLWGSESVKASQQAFEGLGFAPRAGRQWPVSLPPGYEAHADALKRERIVQAGARLARLLQALWP
jgi:hypothetical protein